MRFSLGISSLDEGDDRLRVGLSFLTQTTDWGGRLSYFTRQFGPVHEQLFLGTLFREIGLIQSPPIGVRVGVGGMAKRMRLVYSQTADKSFEDEENRYNLGYHLGTFVKLGWDKRLFFELAWDTTIYPAGLSGGLFLATGAHHLLCISAGVNL